MRTRASRVPGLLISVLALFLASVCLTAVEKAAASRFDVSDSPPVVPVLSPPLKDIPPILGGSSDQKRSVINIELPHPGALPDQPVQPDGALQSKFGVTAPDPAGANFDGLGANGFAPPDNDGGVGPNHYIQWINVQFAIFDKTGTKLYGPANGNTLFTALGPSNPCAATNNGDPIVKYDQLADRWLLTQFVVGASPNFSHQCIALSQTGDPLGAYYLYDFITDAALFVDYPHFGVWPDSYYMTAHIFNAAGTAYLGQGLYAFERPQMLVGLPARIQAANVGGGLYGGALPTDLDGLTPPPLASPNYMIAPGSPELDGTAGTVLHIWKATATWGVTPTFNITGPTDVATAAFRGDLCGFSRNCIPQSGTTTTLDAISDRLMWRLAYRNIGGTESLVMNHTVDALTPPANQAGVRWYEVRSPGSSPTIFQQGTVAPDALHRWMGSIAMDNSGNMALGYSKSSSGIFPEIDITGRLVGDAPGTMGAEIVMKAGAGSQTGGLNRWGDYTAMTVDPRDGCTFWYTNQYQPANGSFNWSTRIASFRFPSCVSPARGTIQGFVTDPTGAPIAGALVSVDNGFSGATDETGRYTIVLPPGSYTVTATAPQKNCNPSASQPATVVNGGVVTLNFTLTGTPIVALGTVGIDDSIGNNNGVINLNECVKLNLPLKNIGCATATGVSAVLSTSTPGVTVTQATSAYANIPAGGTALNVTPFQIATSPSFVCGTTISFTLTVTSSAGTTLLNFSLPSCQAPPITIVGSIGAGDPTQTGRLSRNGVTTTCSASHAVPAILDSVLRRYDAYTFTNNTTTSVCVTTNVTSGCGTNLFYATYLGSFNPANIQQNYLADPGFSFAGTATWSFNVPAGQSFVTVIHEVATTGCASYTLKVDGLIDNSPGICFPSESRNFFTVPPCRVIDTRTTDIPALVAGGSRTFILTGSCGIPSTAQSVSINVAATNETAGGDLRLFAGGTPAPSTSVLNYNAGKTRANNAIVTLGAGGTITIKCDQPSGTADVVLDVNGYFQ